MKRYPGTIPFTAEHKDLFFGRDKEMAELYQLISLEQLVVLYGKSGLGKSSLIQAGIIPKIEDAAIYQPIYIRLTAFKDDKTTDETATPTKIALDTIQKNYEQSTFIQTLRAAENSLWSAAKNRQINGGGHQLILFFDQFEELFQYPERAVNAFMRELRELLNTAIPQRIRDEVNRRDEDFLTEVQEDILYEPLKIKAVFGIRSDRMHLMNKLARSLPQILANNYELQPLALEDAKDAIVKPAQKAGNYDTPIFNYTDSALSQILTFLKDAETSRVEAFQLQLLCQTFEQKVEQEKVKTIDDAAVVNLENIIDTYFQKSISKLSPTDQTLVNQLIAKELVSPDGNVRYSIFEQKLKNDYFISDDLLNQLIDFRLLRRERTNRGVIYEISHDTFLKSARKIKDDLEEQELAKAKAEVEKERKRANRSRVIAIAAIALAIVAGFSGYFAYQAQQKADTALNAIILNNAKSKAQELKNFGDSYKIYGKDTFACDSYRNAFITLDTIEATRQLEIYKTIKDLKEECDEDGYEHPIFNNTQN